MNIFHVALLSIVCTAVAFPVTWLITRSPKLRRPNFRGNVIPTGFGLVLVLAAVPVYAFLLYSRIRDDAIVYVVALLGFGVMGFIDDLFGTRETGGFGGHLGLLRKGKVSTGLMKAVGGGVVGFWVAHLLHQYSMAGWPLFVTVLDGLLIILSANALNLLDLRPGRAVSCFWIGIVTLGAIMPDLGWRMAFDLFPVLLPALILLILDRSAHVMMGDAGSNVLGAVLGLQVALIRPLPVKIAVLLLFILVNVYSERYSISKLIEGNRVLRSLDRLLGER